MKTLTGILLGVCLFIFAFPVYAQEASTTQPLQSADVLFGDDDVLALTLAADLRAVLRDISDDRPYREASLSYLDSDSSEVTLGIRVKTRGFFRRLHLNCDVPPLRLNFKDSRAEHTLFAGQGILKLVTHCRNSKAFEQQLLQEYLIYKAYNLLTPFSFRVRLARITYIDTRGKRKPITKDAFFIENDDRMAERHDGVLLETQRIHAEATDRALITLLSVFQYMMGNTDWGVTSRHNIKVIYTKSHPAPIAVPYDFDWAGLIDASYAKPAPQLNLRSVRERRFMGYCRTEEEFAAVFAQFNEKKEATYALFRDFQPLERKYAQRSIQYLEESYDIINDSSDIRWAFFEACLSVR